MFFSNSARQLEVPLKLNYTCSGTHTVKPIFYCNPKQLVLGSCVGLDSQHDDFALPIPTCWYLKSLYLYPTQSLVYQMPSHVYPTQSIADQMEYSLQWVQSGLIYVKHIYISY